MTFADDFLEEDKELEEGGFVLFGTTISPLIMGIFIGVVGLAGAVYIYLNLAGEARTKYQTVKKQLDEKQALLDEMKQADFPQKMAKLKAEVATQKKLKTRVTSMFTNQDDLDTLLIDLNSFITANQGQLIKYNPDSKPSIISDSSLGSNVNGKLKRQRFSLEIEGTFNNTKAMLQSLERLQPLLMIRDYSSEVSKEPTVILTSDRSKLAPQTAAILTTELEIDAILPMSQKELEAAQKAEAEGNNDEEKGSRKGRSRNRRKR